LSLISYSFYKLLPLKKAFHTWK